LARRFPALLFALPILALLLASPGVAEEDPHAAVFAESSYPSASECGGCHQQIYREWASSGHAYSSISPMFHKFEQTINDLSSGTVKAFCVRCHQQVGTQLGEARELPLWERSRVSREGVTCITCHRVSEQFGRVDGARRIDPGNIHTPVAGSLEDTKLAEVLRDKDHYKVVTEEGERGRPIHTGAYKFEQISESQFCMSCHQVAVHPGIKLEVVWEQYRDSPAAARGVTCQECHMGKEPGRAAGFTTAPTAIVNNEKINPGRRHSNHAFYGPGYPIAHPGIFPHNPRAEQWSIRDWLNFDHRAGWGRPEWEDKLEDEGRQVAFPEPWGDRVDREEAREVIEENLEKLDEKRKLRVAVMENGSRIDGPFFQGARERGKPLAFRYRIVNTNDGHNLPSGSLGAQPEIWLNVALIAPDGKRVWESGYVDSHGDMADLHSLDVRAGKLPLDRQLVNLQTKFLTTNVKGTDREMYLPVNFDIDPIPFIRPGAVPTSVLNHPPFIRMEARSIPPLGHRDANYTVPAELMTQPGTYRLAVRLRSRAEPIYFMKFVKATPEMEQAMNEWMIDVHPYTVEFDVK